MLKAAFEQCVGVHGMNGPYTGDIALTAGTAYSFQANYFQVLTCHLSYMLHTALRHGACPQQAYVPHLVEESSGSFPPPAEHFRHDACLLRSGHVEF